MRRPRRHPAPRRSAGARGVRGAVAAALCLCGSTAAALEATCTFDTICFEAEACDTAQLALRVAPAPEGRVRLGPRGDGVLGDVVTADNGARVIVARSASSFQLLTVLDRAARYTVHLTDGPAVATYHGTCEAE